jgi:hypothetical protein
MSTRTLRHAAVAALAAAFAARADWQGKLVTTVDPPRPDSGLAAREGEIHAKKGKVRIDASMGAMGKGYVLYDEATKKVDVVLPDRKAYVEPDRPIEGAPQAPFGCERGSIDDCLKAQGFAKAGTDAVDGRSCEVWERDLVAGRAADARQKVCVPRGAKEMVWLKNVVESPRFVRTTVVHDYRQTPQPDSLFEVPAGYAKEDLSDLVQQTGGAGATSR